MNSASISLLSACNGDVQKVTDLMVQEYLRHDKADIVHYTVGVEFETHITLCTYEIPTEFLTQHLKGGKAQVSSGTTKQYILRIRDLDKKMLTTAQAVAVWTVSRDRFDEAVKNAGGKTQRGKALEVLTAEHFGAKPITDDRWYIAGDYRLPDGRICQHKSKLATLCSASSVLTAMGMQG